MLKISSSIRLHCIGRINNIAKRANSGNKGAREFEFCYLDSRDRGEHKGDSLVEISEIYVNQDKCVNGTTPYYEV